jgi:putative thioredoxin
MGIEVMENIIEVSTATFEFDVIEQSASTPVVVDFWAPWCGPCRMLGPVLEKLAGDPAFDFVLAKVNVDENPDLSRRFRVQGIPAVKAFVNGQVVAEFTGVQPEPRLRQWLQQLTPSVAEQALAEAHSLLATHQWAEAEEAYRQILLEHGEHPQTLLSLGSALLAQGKGCEALGYLQDCPDGAAYAQAERLLPLAEFLCRAATADDDEEAAPLELQYRQAARLCMRGNLEAALDGVLDVLRQDKRYRRGEAKAVMLAVFALLGDHDARTQSYRQELASVLF